MFLLNRPHFPLCILFHAFILALLLLIINTNTASAQNRVNIIRADSIVGGKVKSEQVQKIIGNVYLQSDSLEMRCDSAYQFTEKSEIRAFGNIEINTREENIWADTVKYFTDIDFSQLRGRVIIEGDSSTLFGNSVDYRFSSKVAHFIDHIRLEDQRGTLIADSGFYYREADSAVFRGQVQLRDSLQYIEGDSLFSNRAKKNYKLYGNIFADDQDNHTMLKGDYLEADSTGRRLVQGNAWLKNFKPKQPDSTHTDSLQPDSIRPAPVPADTIRSDSSRSDSAQPSLPIFSKQDSTRSSPADSTKDHNAAPDTTHIRAKTILSLEHRAPEDTTTTIYAYNNVHIWSKKFSSISDTAHYESKTETFELWSNSKAWHKNVQLTGPFIKVLLQDGDIKRLKSYPNPFVVQEDTTLDRLNQIKGDTLTAYFLNGNLSEIFVNGNSHILRFTKGEEEKPDGAVDMTAPTTRIFFEKGKLKELKSVGAINGSFLPESDQTANRKLDGFAWNPKQRPTRPEKKMKSRFPSIPEERPFQLPRRYLEHIQSKEQEIIPHQK